MTVDLAAVDAANTALQNDPKAAKTTKAYAKAATAALHGLNAVPDPIPPPVPPSGYADFVGACSGYGAGTGLRHTRQDVYGSAFPLTRAQVDAAVAAGTAILPIADFNPWSDLCAGYASDKYAPDTAAHRTTWAVRMISQLRTLYGTPPEAVEVWNEPWLANEYQPARNPESYLALAEAFARACWATPGYEKTKVLVASDTNGDWLARLLAADANGVLKDPRCAPVTHNYTDGPPNTAPSAFPCEWDADRYKCAYAGWKTHGNPDPKVWVTELGWQSDKVGEANQAAYTIAFLKMAHDSGIVARAYAYMSTAANPFTGAPADPWPFNWLRPDGSAKPVVAAVKQLITA